MGMWKIRWNFNRATYTHGECIVASFWLENTSDIYLYLSDLSLKFDFGLYILNTISGKIPPRETKFLGNISLSLPKDVVGVHHFQLKYRIHGYINNSWKDFDFRKTKEPFFITIYPTPRYSIFLSRGLRTEDRIIGDPIAEMIKEWGFETITVGIEIQVLEPHVPIAVREAIKNTDALIGIATPRFVDSLTGMWKTLEWYHDETGIAFGVDKPLVILKDKNTSLGGLPSYLYKNKQAPIIEFDSDNIRNLKAGLSTIMPELRDIIKNKRGQESFNSLWKIVVGGLAVVGGIAVLNGIAGELDGGNRK